MIRPARRRWLDMRLSELGWARLTVIVALVVAVAAGAGAAAAAVLGSKDPAPRPADTHTLQDLEVATVPVRGRAVTCLILDGVHEAAMSCDWGMPR
ncbi:hypothetical protein [Nonomuraea endophytica]|uniref:hypothetical protein n=1 Tax=Nonomuraea endophytica TaxID=714136 RepID=UPI0037C6241D